MTSAEPTWALSIIGARVVGPAPVADVWVPLGRGVEALYGLNGAGKTRLLRSLADLYEGRGSGYVVVQVVPAGDDHHVRRSFTAAFPSSSIERIDSDWMSLADDAPWKATDRPGWQKQVGDVLWSRLWPPATGLNVDDDSTLIRQLDEVLCQGLFALSPKGDGSTWLVEPAVLIDSSTPSLQADADRLLHLTSDFVAEAGRRVPGDPYEPEHEHSDELDEILVEIAKGRAAHGDSLITTMTSFFDALRDPWPAELGREAAFIDEAALVPYRLGGSDSMFEVDTLVGTVAKVTRDDTLTVEGENRRTCQTISSTLWPLVEARDGTVAVGSHLEETAVRLSMLAYLIYADLLADAPDLFLEIGHPETWFSFPPAQWMARDLSGTAVTIDQLSEAQRRWALVAISLALDLDEPEVIDIDLANPAADWIMEPPTIVALDEPDAALHATAQRHAVNGLLRVAEEFDATILCSTHSREFLNSERVRLRHVRRDLGGHVAINDLGAPDRAQLEELGLQPADLFLLHRLILVVEGSHDEVVIKGLIGDELSDARVLIIPMRGGRNLASVVDAHVLHRFSDAPIIAALDNLRSEQIAAFWADLLEHQAGGQVAFDQVVRDHFSNSRQAEETFLINFCRAVAEANELDRFRVFGFSAADIPEYLPVEVLVPGAASWESLRSEFDAQSRDRSFKPWLRRTHEVVVTDELLRAGINAMDTVPQEFIDLAELCRTTRHRPPRS